MTQNNDDIDTVLEKHESRPTQRTKCDKMMAVEHAYLIL